MNNRNRQQRDSDRFNQICFAAALLLVIYEILKF